MPVARLAQFIGIRMYFRKYNLIVTLSLESIEIYSFIKKTVIKGYIGNAVAQW